jgi:hypothetical protein
MATKELLCYLPANTLQLCCCCLSTAWHLSWVRVVNLATGNRALFSANAWLDASLPGSNTWVQLAAAPDPPTAAAAAGLSEQQQQQPGQLGGRNSVFGSGLQYGASENAAGGGGALKLTKAWLHSSKLGQPGYNVTFTTSNILGAGTAARVSRSMNTVVVIAGAWVRAAC